MKTTNQIPSVWAGVGEKRHRGLRVLPKREAFFVHVTSRAVGQAFLFGDAEKRVFIKKMRAWSVFSGIEVVTHCLMDNHFHLLLWVPMVKDVDHTTIVERLALVWPKERLEEWVAYYDATTRDTREGMDAAMVERMGNLPEFMRVLKQTFTCWYNAKENRRGTLWDARYRSVVVEGNPLALLSVAAYIDLNPVRAGLVADPVNAVWSGYGSSCGGDSASRKGLDLLIRCSRGILPDSAVSVRRKQLKESEKNWKETGKALKKEQERRSAPKNWDEVQQAYRIWLYFTGNDGSEDARSREKFRDRKGIDPFAVVAEYERQGKVPMVKMMHQRMRWLTRGLGVGSPEFLEDLMREYRGCFGPKRKKAGKPLPVDIPGVESLREVDGRAKKMPR